MQLLCSFSYPNHRSLTSGILERVILGSVLFDQYLTPEDRSTMEQVVQRDFPDPIPEVLKIILDKALSHLYDLVAGTALSRRMKNRCPEVLSKL